MAPHHGPARPVTQRASLSLEQMRWRTGSSRVWRRTRLADRGRKLLAVEPDVIIGARLRREQVRHVVRELLRAREVSRAFHYAQRCTARSERIRLPGSNKAAWQPLLLPVPPTRRRFLMLTCIVARAALRCDAPCRTSPHLGMVVVGPVGVRRWRRHHIPIHVAARAKRRAHVLDDRREDGLEILLQDAVQLVRLPRRQPQRAVAKLRNSRRAAVQARPRGTDEGRNGACKGS